MYSLWFVQWDFTRRDHPGNIGRVSGSGLVNCHIFSSFHPLSNDLDILVLRGYLINEDS